MSAGRVFTNTGGATAVEATDVNGRWLVYLANPTAHAYGGLDSANTAVWNTASGGAVTATGNRYVFAYQPTLTVTTTDASKTYGDDGAAAIVGHSSVTGLMAGVRGAYLGDAFAGSATLSSDGAATTAQVQAGGYAIKADVSGLMAPAGYKIVTANDGVLTVGRRAITVTADGKSRAYGDANPALTYQVTAGLRVNGDGFTGGLSTAATGASNVGSYAIRRHHG